MERDRDQRERRWEEKPAGEGRRHRKRHMIVLLFFFFLVFLGPHSGHVEVPRVGVESML